MTEYMVISKIEWDDGGREQVAGYLQETSKSSWCEKLSIWLLGRIITDSENVMMKSEVASEEKKCLSETEPSIKK